MPSPGGASALLAAGVTELLEHSVLLGNPGVAGVRTQARTLAAGRSPSRILMLTVAGSLTDRVDGPGMGADDYLAKPFDFPELTARVRASDRHAVGGGGSSVPHARAPHHLRIRHVLPPRFVAMARA